MSLRELWLELDAARERQRRDHDQAVTMAWYAANLVWQKQLPPLARLLAPRERKQSMTELRSVVERLSALTGIALVRRPRS